MSGGSVSPNIVSVPWWYSSTPPFARARAEANGARPPARHIVEPINFVMEAEMMRGIKRRAEHHAIH